MLVQCWANVSTPTMTCCQQLQPLPNNGMRVWFCVFTRVQFITSIWPNAHSKKNLHRLLYIAKAITITMLCKNSSLENRVYPTCTSHRKPQFMLFIVNTQKFSEYKTILYLISRYTVFVFNYIYLCKPRRLQSVYYGFKSLQFRHLFYRIISSMKPGCLCPIK